MQTQLWSPVELEPSAGIMLGAAKVRRNQESFVLREELGLPVAIDRVRAIDEAIGDRATAGKELCTTFVLAIATFIAR